MHPWKCHEMDRSVRDRRRDRRLARPLGARPAPTFSVTSMSPARSISTMTLARPPILQAIDGTDGMGGSGSAFGGAKLGDLGARATVVTLNRVSGFSVGSSARAVFDDVFVVNSFLPSGDSGVAEVHGLSPRDPPA